MKKLLIALFVGVTMMFASCSNQGKDLSYDLYLKGDVSVDGNTANVDWKFNSSKGDFQKQLDTQYLASFPGATKPEPMKLTKSEFENDSAAIGSLVDHYLTSASKTRTNVLYNVTFGGKVGLGVVQWKIPDMIFSNIPDSTAMKTIDAGIPTDTIQ